MAETRCKTRGKNSVIQNNLVHKVSKPVKMYLGPFADSFPTAKMQYACLFTLLFVLEIWSGFGFFQKSTGIPMEVYGIQWLMNNSDLTGEEPLIFAMWSYLAKVTSTRQRTGLWVPTEYHFLKRFTSTLCFIWAHCTETIPSLIWLDIFYTILLQTC